MEPGDRPIFISHSSEDAATSQEIVRLLEARGLKAWIAPRDIAAGHSYGEQILQGLERCGSMLLVLSVASNQSQFVAREVERAVSQGKMVIPFRIQNVLPSKALEFFVSSSHWVDAFSVPLDVAVNAVAQTVQSTAPGPGPGATRVNGSSGMGRFWGRFGHVKKAVVATAGVGAVLSGMVGFYTTYKTVAAPSSVPSASAVTAATANGVNPLSIVVLPFANLTGDPAQTYVADGLTVSVTSDLSRLQGAFIVNVATAAAYKDKTADAQQVGQKLGVRFVLQGNVQRSANKLRINAQLADTTSNAQLWSESFEGDQSDLFALQDQVTTRIGNSIGREMLVNAARASEKAKSSPKVADLLLRARAMQLAQRTLTYFDELEGLWRAVLKLEPDNALALGGLASVMGLRAAYFSHSLAPERLEPYFAESRDLALKAKQLDPDSPLVYGALALYAESHDDYAGALRYAKTSYQLTPREQRAANLLAHELLLGGDYKQALLILEQTLSLNPKFPLDQVIFNLGWGSFQKGDYDASIAWFQRTIETNSTYIDAYGWMAMAYAIKGDMVKSKDQLQKLQKADPKGSFMTRRQPMPSSPQVYKDFYKKTVLPAAQKAGIVS